MKHCLLSILVCLSFLPLSQAQEAAWAQKIFNGVTTHDFGTCARGAQLKYRLKMKNIYAVPLQITNIRSSCGCLSFEPNTKNLKPQEEGYIDILMDGRRFVGPKSVTLYVTVGPQYISTAAVTFTANARGDVVLNPGEINFGVVASGSQVTQTIDVEYAGSLDWQIVEVVKSKNAPFEVQPRELYRNKPRIFQGGKVGYQLAVTLKADAPAGAFTQKILLKTNDPASPVLTVNVEGNIQASLTANPSEIAFRNLKVGQKESQRIVVRGTQPFEIKEVKGSGNGIRTNFVPRRAAVHFVDIELTPTATGEFARQLEFVTDQGTSTAISIRAEVK